MESIEKIDETYIGKLLFNNKSLSKIIKVTDKTVKTEDGTIYNKKDGYERGSRQYGYVFNSIHAKIPNEEEIFQIKYSYRIARLLDNYSDNT